MLVVLDREVLKGPDLWNQVAGQCAARNLQLAGKLKELAFDWRRIIRGLMRDDVAFLEVLLTGGPSSFFIICNWGG